MNIAKKIDQAMRANRLRPMSQAELARISGVPQPTISRTLKGVSTPDLDTLLKIGQALNLDFGGIKSQPKSIEITDEEIELLQEFRKIISQSIRREVIGYVRGVAAASGPNPSKKSRRNTSTSPSQKKAA